MAEVVSKRSQASTTDPSDASERDGRSHSSIELTDMERSSDEHDTVEEEVDPLLEDEDEDDRKQKPEETRTTAKTTYVSRKQVVFWLSMWFFMNIGVTFWNKKALGILQLPVLLTFIHMLCNSMGAYVFIYILKGTERKVLEKKQQSIMIYFSFIFVSNIITGNWSLGLVSISFNQVMRALVPGVTVFLSMIILNKSYTTKRKLALVPVAIGVYLACSGDNAATLLGFIITAVAVCFAGLKAVLSNKFLSGDLKLHPVDLILHQAPLSAVWCLITAYATGEIDTLIKNWEIMPQAISWYLLTGCMSFLLNITSFYSNKVTSAVTLTVCGNIKQIMVIMMSIFINNDSFTTQKMIGICVVTFGGSMYAYISNREMMEAQPQAKTLPK